MVSLSNHSPLPQGRGAGGEGIPQTAHPELAPGRQAEANRAGLLALTRPGGLGDFKVLVQGKNVGQPKLWGFEPSPSVGELIETLPLPLLTDRHISLPDAWRPSF